MIFEQRDVEVPADWSQTATNIVASKYFHGKPGSPERETQRGPTGSPRRGHHRRLGIERQVLPNSQDAENFRNELAHLMLTQKACFNSPVWFNVGVKEARGYGWYLRRDSRHASGSSRPGDPAAMLRLLHRLREGFARIDSRSRQDRRHAVQVGLRHRHEPVRPSRGGRHSLGRRPRVRSAQLHEGLRRLCRCHQARRQNPSRREDGDPERRPPGHRKVHLVQGEGREEGPHAHRCRLRFVARRRSVQLHLLPERQQQRPRDRRIHARGGRKMATGGPSRASTASR